MDIGIICQKASTGGWRYALMLACALRQAHSSTRVTVYCRTRQLPSAGHEALVAAGVELVRLPKLPPSQSALPLKQKRFVGLETVDERLNALRRRWKDSSRDSRRRQFANAIARHDIVHFAWPYDIDPPPYEGLMSFIPHDFIYTHEFGVANYTEADWIATRKAHQRWLACASPIVSSHFIADELRRSFPAYGGPVDVVYLSSLNPLPAGGIHPADVVNVRQRFNLDGRYILCPNNIMPHKNLSALIAALWHVRHSGSDAKLVVCGVETEGIRATVTGPLYANRTESATEWDILGVGLVNDRELLALMHGATLVVNPSLCEAGSGSGLDAWGCGCPVALSDIPAFRDQVNFLGTSAEFFDPRDPRDIARVILGVLAEPNRSAHAAEVSRKAMVRYGWNDVAAGYLAVFERLVGKF